MLPPKLPPAATPRLPRAAPLYRSEHTPPEVSLSDGVEQALEISDGLQCWQGPPDTPPAGRPPTHGLDLARQWPRLYPALRSRAARLMARERDGHTLSPTALVNEARLQLGRGPRPVHDEAHGLALATRAMRHVLVNHAKARAAAKRPGQAAHLTLSLAEHVPAHRAGPDELLALDQALRQLASEDARAARVAELKASGGLQVPEIARAGRERSHRQARLGVCPRSPGPIADLT